MTDPVSFRTVVVEARTNATGLLVPADAIAALGSGARPVVVVEVEGYTYRSTVGVMGGRSLIPLSAAHRAASGLVGGQEVDVTLTLDDQPRTVALPGALDDAIGADDAAHASFAALSPSRQKALALSVTDAKTDETRARRVEKSLEALRG